MWGHSDWDGEKKMSIGRWHLGWSRNAAIGVVWTDTGKIAFLFLGIALARGFPVKPPRSARKNPCGKMVAIPNSSHADFCVDVKDHAGECQSAHWNQDRDFCWCDK